MGRSAEKKAALGNAKGALLSPPQDKEARPVDVSNQEISDTTFEEKHVFGVYEEIAAHFSATRYKPWPKVEKFVTSLPVGSLVLDAGCGNGKNLTFKNARMIGSDRARAFCDIARDTTGCDTFVSDISRDTGLSLRQGLFDAAISIAVIHHIPTVLGRIAALTQLARSLKPEGLALIYVWAFEQAEGSIGARKFESQDVFVPWHYQTRYEGDDNKTDDDHGKFKAMQRYYHVFTRVEFASLLDKVKDLFMVIDIYFDSNNWAAVLKRN